MCLTQRAMSGGMPRTAEPDAEVGLVGEYRAVVIPGLGTAAGDGALARGCTEAPLFSPPSPGEALWGRRAMAHLRIPRAAGTRPKIPDPSSLMPRWESGRESSAWREADWQRCRVECGLDRAGELLEAGALLRHCLCSAVCSPPCAELTFLLPRAALRPRTHARRGARTGSKGEGLASSTSPAVATPRSRQSRSCRRSIGSPAGRQRPWRPGEARRAS